jgi:hypothetical protein
MVISEEKSCQYVRELCNYGMQAPGWRMKRRYRRMKRRQLKVGRGKMAKALVLKGRRVRFIDVNDRKNTFCPASSYPLSSTLTIANFTLIFFFSISIWKLFGVP